MATKKQVPTMMVAMEHVDAGGETCSGGLKFVRVEIVVVLCFLLKS